MRILSPPSSMKSTPFSALLATVLAAALPLRSADLPFPKEGNIQPSIVKLSPDQEAAILKDVQVPQGFEVTLFANSQAANYPVFVAAAPDGTLYVSSDGNGSLGRNPKRGRVIRLRDQDGDGRADETKVFCEVDSPRGLVWVKDRLFLVHPPHLSEFIDADHDGVAEKENVLVKDIAFGFADRPADHTTNGLSLGIDGWLYIAGGDFGFVKATGTDGKTLQHRGGGVIRVRQDGTGLELFSDGTRNILEVAISPQMDLFARDNTNDGGGWDVRLHHFTGKDNHGYPRLFKHFSDECIQPIADYGGGSGCGAVYIEEPGFGSWNDAPFTADWGTGALYKHRLEAKGATFIEKEKPEPFVKMTRPTDADVDALGNVYCASWKGATFNWEGPDVGYIVRVRPVDFIADPLPDFAKASEPDLLNLVRSTNSQRRRIEAMNELRSRGSKEWDNHWAKIRGRMTPERNEIENIKTAEARMGKVAVTYLCAQTQHRDPYYSHVATKVLSETGKTAEIFAWLDMYDETKRGVCRALAMIGTPEVVTGLIDRLDGKLSRLDKRELLSALCRLYYREGEWKGDSWGTRPDTRGPYYQPETWSESARIAAALKKFMTTAKPTEVAYLVGEMGRNRIKSDDALRRVLELAKTDRYLTASAVAQLAVADNIPAEAIPLLTEAAAQVHGEYSFDKELPTTSAKPGEIPLAVRLTATTRFTPATLTQAVTAIVKTDNAEAWRAALTALVSLSKTQGTGKEQEAAASAFFDAPKLENVHQLMEEEAANTGSPTAAWAEAALIHLASRTSGSPESREMSMKALEKGWDDAKRRIQIIRAAGKAKKHLLDDKILAATADSNPVIAKAAKETVNTLKIKPKAADDTPKVSSLKPEQALSAVLAAKGDVALGEQIFTKATCVACHTVSQSQPLKGPYLGNIAQTYKRPDLAMNILDPNRTIAQGFASELITMKDGTAQMGFITLEGAQEVKLRNIAAQEFTFKTADIAKREKLPTSMMPPMLMANFTVHEFASLLDYLESLVKK